MARQEFLDGQDLASPKRMTDSQPNPDPNSEAESTSEEAGRRDEDQGKVVGDDQSGPGEAAGDQVSAAAREPVGEDEGPGWLPAIMAGTVLFGVLGFICCGVSTWVLFQKRTEFAVRTLRDWYVPQLEQSYLEPDEKKAVIDRIETLAQEMDAGKYENWQSAAVMQRLQRLPVLQWGELSAVEIHLRQGEANDDQAEGLMQLSRLCRGVELGKVTTFDFEEVLKPVMVSDDSAESGRRMSQPLDDESVKEVIDRARKVADRSEVPDQTFDVSVDNIVRREIEAGITKGGY